MSVDELVVGVEVVAVTVEGTEGTGSGNVRMSEGIVVVWCRGVAGIERPDRREAKRGWWRCFAWFWLGVALLRGLQTPVCCGSASMRLKRETESRAQNKSGISDLHYA